MDKNPNETLHNIAWDSGCPDGDYSIITLPVQKYEAMQQELDTAIKALESILDCSRVIPSEDGKWRDIYSTAQTALKQIKGADK